MIDKREFASIMAVAAAAVGKDLTRDQARVYWSLLNDLPADALKAGLSRALLEHEYPTIPSVGMIRRLSVESMRGHHLTPAEAWSLVREVLTVGGGFEGFKNSRARLPEFVRNVASLIGWPQLRENESRKDFVFAYRDAVDRDRVERLIPEHLHKTMVRLTSEGDDRGSTTPEAVESEQPIALEEEGDSR